MQCEKPQPPLNVPRAPFFRSHAAQDPRSLDDMGVAIFWKASRLEALELTLQPYPGVDASPPCPVGWSLKKGHAVFPISTALSWACFLVAGSPKVMQQ